MLLALALVSNRGNRIGDDVRREERSGIENATQLFGDAREIDERLVRDGAPRGATRRSWLVELVPGATLPAASRAAGAGAASEESVRRSARWSYQTLPFVSHSLRLAHQPSVHNFGYASHIYA